ncbi:MAG TPA: hypothetical protein V6C65_04505 [Allocoleopsis sp.]
MLVIPAVLNEEGAAVPAEVIPAEAVKVEYKPEAFEYEITMPEDIPEPPPPEPFPPMPDWAGWLTYIPEESTEDNLAICAELLSALTGAEALFGQSLIAEIQKPFSSLPWLIRYWNGSLASVASLYRDRFNTSAVLFNLPVRIAEDGKLEPYEQP